MLEWRDDLSKCLSRCCDCVVGFFDARDTLKTEYDFKPNRPFPNSDADHRWLPNMYSDNKIQKFVEQVNARDTERILQSLGNLQDTNNRGPTRERFTPGLLLQILSNSCLYQDRHILDLLASLSQELPDIPSPPPAGLLALTVYTDPQLRIYARNRLKTATPIELNSLDRLERRWVLESLTEVVKARQISADTPYPPQVLAFSYTTNKTQFWKGLASIASVLGRSLFDKDPQYPGREPIAIGFFKFICSHLGDMGGDHIFHVFAAWTSLLNQGGPAGWSLSNYEAPEIALHAILDNVQFEEAVRLSGQMTREINNESALHWPLPFFKSIATSEQFPACLSAFTVAMFDRFQHDRFAVQIRILAARTALNVLLEMFDAKPPSDWDESSSTVRTHWIHLEKFRADYLDKHSRFLAFVGFGSKGPDAQLAGFWKQIEESARDLTQKILQNECTRVCQVLPQYAQVLRTKRIQDVPSLPIISAPTTLWRDSFRMAAGRSNTPTLPLVFLRGFAPVAHLTSLEGRVWLPEEFGESLRPRIQAINKFFESTGETSATDGGVRTYLVDLLEEMADWDTSKLLESFATPDAVQLYVIAILSPVESVHTSALGVVRSAFDVDSRADCFRALLKNKNKETFRALTGAMNTFAQTVDQLPDSCGMAKRLVRCLSDILEALCDNTRGLFLDAIWLKQDRPKGQLEKMWKSMCQSIAIVFEHTSVWAAYYPNKEMTEWMRDAIIFADGMLENVRAFGAIVAGKDLMSAQQSPVAKTPMARAMIDGLNEPLERILGWLRLNDDDLLTRSVILIRKFINLFVESEVPVNSTVLKRIEKYTMKSQVKSGPLASQRADLTALCVVLSKHPSHRGAFSEINGVEEAIELENKRDHKEWWAKQTSTATVKHGYKSSQSTLIAPKEKPKKSNEKRDKPLALNFGQPPMKSSRLTYSHAAVRASRDLLEDESEDEELGEGKGLQSLVKTQESSHPVIRALPTKKVKAFDVRTGREITPITSRPRPKSVFSAQQSGPRTRIAPDFTKLHRLILQWDFGHVGDAPPIMASKPPAITATFETADDYMEAFEPLFLLELWQALVRAREEMMYNDHEPLPVQVSSRQSVDDFTDLFLSIPFDRLPNRSFFTESDLILLRSGQHRSLAKIQSIKTKREGYEVTLRCHLGQDFKGLSAALVPRSHWELIKLFS